MYELYDPFSIMCFYRNKPLLLDTGFGLDTKITALSNSWEALADVLADAICHAEDSKGLSRARGQADAWSAVADWIQVVFTSTPGSADAR